MNTLSVTALSKKYGQKILLDTLSLALAQGETIGVFGRNGSGKSTLLRILFGLEKPDKMTMTLNDKTVTPAQLIRSQKLGCLPQHAFLPKHLKVRDVIPVFFHNSEDQDRIFYIEHIAGMTDQNIGNLSMGQRRFLEVMLLLHLPHSFVLLDEPFSMIEPLYKEAIKTVLISLKAKKGILITDHYYADVLAISDRNLLLNEGKLHPVNHINDLQEKGYLGQIAP